MKRTVFASALLALTFIALTGSMHAQLAGTVMARTSLDSVTGIRGRVATDLFGAYKYVNLGSKVSTSNDFQMSKYQIRYMHIKGLGVTDSVKIQGCTLTAVNRNTSTNAISNYDSTWADIPVTYKRVSKTGIDNRGAFAHDTTVTWISDVGVDQGSTFTVDWSAPAGFVAYRVVTGINDTSAVKFRTMGRASF